MKAQKFLLTMTAGFLLTHGAVKAQDDFVKQKPKELPNAEPGAPVRPPVLPNYPNLEKAIDLFLLEWSAKTRQPLPKKGISITPEVGTKRYKLSLESGQGRRSGFRGPQWAGDFQFSRQTGLSNEVAFVYDPTGRSNEDNSQTVFESRSQVRSFGGFSQSYSRSYERSYSTENAPRQVAVRPRFADRPQAYLHLFADVAEYHAAYDEARKSRRLVTNGTHEETEEIAGYYYLVVLGE